MPAFVRRNALSAAVEGLVSPLDITIRLDLGPPPRARRRVAPGSPDMRASRLRLHRFGHTFLQRHHRSPTAAEVVAGLGLPPAEAAATIAATHAPLCVEDVAHGALPRLQLPTAGSPTDRDMLRELQAVPGDEQFVREAGQYFDVTRERIRPIEAKALRKLRRPSHSPRLRAFIEE